MTRNHETAVFIAGGGPVGLAMALLLERFGVECVLVERSHHTTRHPKARGLVARSMEMMRQLGIEDRIRARGLTEGGDSTLVVETVAGRHFGHIKAEPDAGQSPAWKAVVAQDAVEDELCLALRGGSAELHFGTEFIDFREDADGVVIRTRPSGGAAYDEWHARYLIAADGAASTVREQAGIGMIGPDMLALYANDFWRADLSGLPAARRYIGFQTIPADDLPPSVILNTNGTDLWLTLTRLDIAPGTRWQPWTDDELRAMIRRQVGLPDLEIELLGRAVWKMGSQVAASYRRGRMFLVGDAAHRIPPTGGYGLNTGFQDVHNLAWKLSFVLAGLAPDRLLDTYESERMPVAQSNADWSAGNAPRWPALVDAVRSGNSDRIAFWLSDMENHFHNVGRALGYCYEEGAIIGDGTVAEPLVSRFYTPTDRPGARFPHLWLDPERQQSTLDWFDRSLALVAGPDGAQWLEAAADLSRELRLPVDGHILPDAGPDDVFHIGRHGALLVRPDGHIAWRRPWLDDDPKDSLRTALKTLFG